MTKKKSFILASILISLLLGVAVYYAMSKPVSNGPSFPEATENTPQTSESTNTQSPSEPEKPADNDPGTPANTSVSLSIARITQLSDGTVSIRANVNGTSSGECVFSFTGPNNASFERKSAVKLQQTHYACSNIDIERSAFGAGGSWSVTAHIQDSEKTTQSFVVE